MGWKALKDWARDDDRGIRVTYVGNWDDHDLNVGMGVCDYETEGMMHDAIRLLDGSCIEGNPPVTVKQVREPIQLNSHLDLATVLAKGGTMCGSLVCAACVQHSMRSVQVVVEDKLCAFDVQEMMRHPLILSGCLLGLPIAGRRRHSRGPTGGARRAVHARLRPRLRRWARLLKRPRRRRRPWVWRQIRQRRPRW